MRTRPSIDFITLLHNRPMVASNISVKAQSISMRSAKDRTEPEGLIFYGFFSSIVSHRCVHATNYTLSALHYIQHYHLYIHRTAPHHHLEHARFHHPFHPFIQESQLVPAEAEFHRSALARLECDSPEAFQLFDRASRASVSTSWMYNCTTSSPVPMTRRSRPDWRRPSPSRRCLAGPNMSLHRPGIRFAQRRQQRGSRPPSG